MGILSGSLDEFEKPSLRELRHTCWRSSSYWSLIIVVPWLLAAAVSIWQWQVYSSAATRQAITSGLVTEVAQGNRVHYEFAVANHTFRNYEIPLYDRRVPSPGEIVTIYYDPETPTVNGITDFHTRSLDALGPVPFIFLLSGAAIAGIVYWKRRNS